VQHNLKCCNRCLIQIPILFFQLHEVILLLCLTILWRSQQLISLFCVSCLSLIGIQNLLPGVSDLVLFTRIDLTFIFKQNFSSRNKFAGCLCEPVLKSFEYIYLQVYGFWWIIQYVELFKWQQRNEYLIPTVCICPISDTHHVKWLVHFVNAFIIIN